MGNPTATVSKQPNRILVVIILAQFCCTSLWFAGNGIIDDLIGNFQLETSALSHLTSAVQFGFICGTLVFAILTIADRFSPSKVFFISALLGALLNAGIILEGNGFASLLVLRFLTGFFLAGIYPVGMKIAADYYDKSLGKSLGFLVGALVLGTAFPHLLNGFLGAISWKVIVLATSGLAIFGGAIMLIMVPDGPYRRPSQHLNLSASVNVFRNANFRSAAFGYFGHMWELYAFWAFVPIILKAYADKQELISFSIPVLSFLIIGIGSVACVVGGFLALKYGEKRIALIALLLSGVCCLISPMVLSSSYSYLFVGFLFFWGMVVIADSPLFSTLVAQNATPEIKGTALTVVNCIGFSITIISIQLLNGLMNSIDPDYLYVVLGLGPIIGLIALTRK